MYVSALQFPAPLDRRPRIGDIGLSLHHRAVLRYRFDDLWCIHLYRYSAELVLDGTALPIRPGHVSMIAPGVEQEYRLPGRSTHFCAHFRMRSGGDGAVRLPAMQDLGERFDGINESFRQLIEYHALDPRRAEIRLWDLLWQIAEAATARRRVAAARASAAAQGSRHPALLHALRLIEEGLDGPLPVAALAHRAGVSHNHLTRLFRGAFALGVSAYIRHRRMLRAKHLLLNTDLPVAAIARAVGSTDLTLFNRWAHRELGASPRGVRDAAMQERPRGS